jgi:acetyl-CoA carboxylase carboxyl transferase beta subunit
MSSRIDVSIEHRNVPEPPGKQHPNTCPACHSHYRDDELEAALWVCPHCGHHFPMRARSRIASLADGNTFVEEAAELRSEDPLNFFDLRPYTERLAEAEMKTGLGEAMVIGQAAIDGTSCELAVMDFSFMGGSMGSVVGEKFARICDSAAEASVPVVSVSASGGARMQEGILALMQLPKTVVAIEELHEAGGSLVSVLAHVVDDVRHPAVRLRVADTFRRQQLAYRVTIGRVDDSHVPTPTTYTTILFSGYSTMPCPPAALSFSATTALAAPRWYWM